MKKVIYRTVESCEALLSLSGLNLLKGVLPAVIADGGDASDRIACSEETVQEVLCKLTDSSQIAQDTFISVAADECTFIYDMRESVKVDRIYIGSRLSNETAQQEYGVYIADDLQTLFNRENEVEKFTLQAQDFTESRNNRVLDTEGYCGRYFAVKIAAPSPVGIYGFALYNHDRTDKYSFFNKNFAHNILSGITPTVKGSYSADLSLLTDGVCFDDAHRTVINAETEYIFKLERETAINGIAIIGSPNSVEKCVVFFGNEKDTVFDDENLTEIEPIFKPTSRDGTAAALLKTHGEIAAYIGLRLPADCVIDQLGAEEYIVEPKSDSAAETE